MFTKYTIAAVAAVALSSAAANAGVVTFVTANNDAASGISTANTYTAKTSFGSNPVTVNGVTFEALGGSNPVYTITGATASAVGGAFPEWKSDAENIGFPGGSNVAAGDFKTLLTQFRYTPSHTDHQEIVLTDLVAGQTYDFRVYGRAWTLGNRNVTLAFTGDGATTNYSFNEDGTLDGWYVSHVFTYDGVSVAGYSVGNNFHAYGFSNQIVPEPASIGLLGLAGLGMLARRRMA